MPPKYAIEIALQREEVERLEMLARVAEKSAREAREKANNAARSYNVQVCRLIPKDVPKRKNGLWPIDTSKPKAKKTKANIASEVKATLTAEAEIRQLLGK